MLLKISFYKDSYPFFHVFIKTLFLTTLTAGEQTLVSPNGCVNTHLTHAFAVGGKYAAGVMGHVVLFWLTH